MTCFNLSIESRNNIYVSRGAKKKNSITCYVTVFCFLPNENKFSSQLHQALPFAFVIIITKQTTNYISSPSPQL